MENRDQFDAFFPKQDALFRRQKADSEAHRPESYAEMRKRIAQCRESDIRYMSMAGSAHDQKPRFLTDVNSNERIVLGLRRIAPAVDP